jgi:alpha-L-rhamnosidase
MKKLVWSETTVQGGIRFNGKLASPPHVTGPFQNIPFAPAAFAFEAKPVPQGSRGYSP